VIRSAVATRDRTADGLDRIDEQAEAARSLAPTCGGVGFGRDVEPDGAVESQVRGDLGAADGNGRGVYWDLRSKR
jgi:hypothetical protein